MTYLTALLIAFSVALLSLGFQVLGSIVFGMAVMSLLVAVALEEMSHSHHHTVDDDRF